MDNMTKLLIPLAVAINMLAYNVLYSTTMVILGDSIGTILVGAICGPGPHSKPETKYKRRRKFSVRSLRAAVDLGLLTA